MNTTLSTLKASYEKAVSNYVSAYNNHEKRSKLKGLKSLAADAVKAYNAAAEKEAYRDWNKEGDPIRVAIRTLCFNKGVSVSYKIDDDTDVMSATYKPADIKVSLPVMHATLGAGVFNSPDWFSKCEKLAYMYAGYLAEILGTASFDYSIRDISKAFNFPEGADVYSPEGIQNALQMVFDAILYIDNPDAPGTNLISARSKVVHGNKVVPAWTFITHRMTADDVKNDCLKLCNTGKFSYLVASTMHKIMTSTDFVLTQDDQYAVPDNSDDAADENDTTEASEASEE